jgi:hypothetical protein
MEEQSATWYIKPNCRNNTFSPPRKEKRRHGQNYGQQYEFPGHCMGPRYTGRHNVEKAVHWT